MSEASIPVDLFNPGQVFACLGFMEAAEILLGDAAAAFDWRDPAAVRFWLRARGDVSPFARVLEFVDEAEVLARAPEGSPNIEKWNDAWGTLESIPRGKGYPFRDPGSPATLVCILQAGRHEISIDHWGEDRADTSRDNVKFWAGAGGYPGTALARDALGAIGGRARSAATDPFAFRVRQSSSFRLDWRRDYIPIDAGFSLNAHGDMSTLGYPLVELLGAVGLSHARPRRVHPRNKLQYFYGVTGRSAPSDDDWLPPSIVRAALGGDTSVPFPTRRFRMFLNWPGKEGQARSITTVTEEAVE